MQALRFSQPHVSMEEALGFWVTRISLTKFCTAENATAPKHPFAKE